MWFQTKIDNIAAELEDIMDELTKSPSVISGLSENPYSPDKVTEDGVDRISVQSEKHGTDPYHLQVGNHKVLKFAL